MVDIRHILKHTLPKPCICDSCIHVTKDSKCKLGYERFKSSDNGTVSYNVIECPSYTYRFWKEVYEDGEKERG